MTGSVWFPFVQTATGSTAFVHALAGWLQQAGVRVHVQQFAHAFQYAPMALRAAPAPSDACAVLTNSWNGFAFHRPGLRSVCVEHLFVLDPALAPYKNAAQSLFHNQMVRRFMQASYRTATQVVAVSDYTRRQIGARFPHIAVRTIANGVDTARFQPADSLPDGPLRLLFAGTPSLRKGVDLLPAILNAVRDDIRLSITADPDALPGLADHPQINFLGRVAPANMAETYRAHSALLMPTRMEGLPLAALEAMACGLPVIASDASSLPEAVLDGETGLLVPAGDAHGFAQAVAALHDNSDMRSRMGAAARRRAEGHFTLERMGRDYARVLGVSANA